MPSTFAPQIRSKLRRGVVLITAGVILAFWLIESQGTLAWLEDRSSDARVKATLQPPGDSRIVVIDIDNASFRTLTDQLGRWPWTRRVWTEVVRYINPGRPRLIVFDILFSGSEPEADMEFADTICAAGNVILPFTFVSGRIDTDADIFTPPEAARVKVAGARGLVLTRDEWSVNAPNPLLAAAASGTGSNLWTPDPDGVTRRLPVVIRYDGHNWATFWLAAALKLNGAGPLRYGKDEFSAGPIRLPVDRDGNYVVRWRGGTLDAYRHIPLWEVICSIYPLQCDPSAPKHSPEVFRDRIVFIGATAAGSYEVRPTAVSETASGMFVAATALDNILNGEGVRRAPEWLAFLLIAALAALPSGGITRHRSLTIPLTVTAGVLAAYGAGCFWFYGQGYWLPMSTPMLAAAFSFTANTAYRYLTVDRELLRTRDTLERYVSPQLVGYVMDHLGEFRFDGEKRKLTVFFSDVRGFTTLTEKSDPVQLLKQLNEYLEAMTDIIFRHDGIVDKFIGDGIMAHWGAFTPDRPNARMAAAASLDMLRRLDELNAAWAVAGKPQLEIGIGLNTGDVIFGNVGTGKKVDFTAIGDGVNLAARLESANKEYGTNIIISEATLLELGSGARVRPLGSAVVKGKSAEVKIFELLDLNG